MKGFTEPECRTCVKVDPGRLDVTRFMTRLDSYFAVNDMKGAGEYLRYWEREAQSIGDHRGLLTVLNEEAGFFRRTGEEDAALCAVSGMQALLDEGENAAGPSAAVLYTNMATTLGAFGKTEEALPLYDRAEALYREYGMEDTYEFAAFLNNRAGTLSAMKLYDEAEADIRRAVETLKTEGRHDGDIAVSLISLAHLTFDRDDTAYEQVEDILEQAWNYLNSPRQPHDASFALVLKKIAPSLRYFQRNEEADMLDRAADKIYGGNT